MSLFYWILVSGMAFLPTFSLFTPLYPFLSNMNWKKEREERTLAIDSRDRKESFELQKTKQNKKVFLSLLNNILNNTSVSYLRHNIFSLMYYIRSDTYFSRASSLDDLNYIGYNRGDSWHQTKCLIQKHSKEIVLGFGTLFWAPTNESHLC